jgi:hypothetical protein
MLSILFALHQCRGIRAWMRSHLFATGLRSCRAACCSDCTNLTRLIGAMQAASMALVLVRIQANDIALMCVHDPV